MPVQILFFGSLTDITGTASLEMEAVAGTAELTKQLHLQFPALAFAKYTMAVNKEMVTADTPLTPGSTIALLPPFSGG